MLNFYWYVHYYKQYVHNEDDTPPYDNDVKELFTKYVKKVIRLILIHKWHYTKICVTTVGSY